MQRGNIKLNNPERFMQDYDIPMDKLDAAINVAVSKLKSKIPVYMNAFPKSSSKGYQYPLGENDNWVCGLLTGCYNLAYELTGDEEFNTLLKEHMINYRDRADRKVELEDHDVGFIFSPSCVAYHKLTGDATAKETALKAAEILYNECYTEKGGFILRWGWTGKTCEEKYIPFCRTMMDTMLNIPLFFWAGIESGDDKYTKAALSQCDVTNRCLVREDGSTYHHYQFEQGTFKPLYGLTFQGLSDESTWSRGHSWGVYGFSIAYAYSGTEYMMPLQRDLTYYFLNHLPEDNISYWDFTYTSGDEPRDTSAAAISACGMLEAVRHMDNDDVNARIYKNAANMIIEAIIDNYTNDPDSFDGLFTGVTPMRTAPQYGIEECALYGDYYYLEALMRLKNPDWKMYW